MVAEALFSSGVNSSTPNLVQLLMGLLINNTKPSHRHDQQLHRIQPPITRSNSSSSNSSSSSSSSSSSPSSPSILSSTIQERVAHGERYKTELCRHFKLTKRCKYGEKCQYAHGHEELRNMSRHPKYKTDRCRTFHTTGFCPYGSRCHFLHEYSGEEENETTRLINRQSSSTSVQKSQEKMANAYKSYFSLQDGLGIPHRTLAYY